MENSNTLKLVVNTRKSIYSNTDKRIIEALKAVYRFKNPVRLKLLNRGTKWKQ